MMPLLPILLAATSSAAAPPAADNSVKCPAPTGAAQRAAADYYLKIEGKDKAEVKAPEGTTSSGAGGAAGRKYVDKTTPILSKRSADPGSAAPGASSSQEGVKTAREAGSSIATGRAAQPASAACPK